MKFKKVLLSTGAAVALAAASSAQAGDYFTVFGGVSFQQDIQGSQSFSATRTGLTQFLGLGSFYQFSTVSASFDQDLDSGFVLGAAYGRNWNQHWRGELELAYRENQVDGDMKLVETGNYGFLGGGVTYLNVYKYLTTVPITALTTVVVPSLGLFGDPYNPGGLTATVPADGSVSHFSIMANVWYDFNIAGPWETFFGLGAGMAQVNANNITAPVVAPPGTYTRTMSTLIHLHSIAGSGTDLGPFTSKATYAALLDPVLSVDGSDWVFAYQFGLGAGYNLDNGVRLSAQFRYFGTEEAEIDGVELDGEATEMLFGISFPLGN